LSELFFEWFLRKLAHIFGGGEKPSFLAQSFKPLLFSIFPEATSSSHGSFRDPRP
jgi:hypothetical protein